MRLTVLLLALSSLTAWSDPLRSPWDSISISLTDTPFSCQAIQHLPQNFRANSYYRKDDPTHSIIDPALYQQNQQVIKPIYGVQHALNTAADAYRTTGSRAAAQCTIAQIVSLAQDNALNGSDPETSQGQSSYVQGWVAGSIAVDWLKVRGSGLATTQQTEQVAAWLHSIGEKVRHYYDSRRDKGDGGNNHAYWAGFQLAATGIMANQRGDYTWGVEQYRHGVAEIRPDGSLPREMSRGQRALHYHLYALMPLIMIATLGESNGEDLYAASNGAIHRLVDFCVRNDENPEPLQQQVGVPQERESRPSGGQFAWAVPYLRRFPDHPELKMLANQVESMRFDTIGGLPPR